MKKFVLAAFLAAAAGVVRADPVLTFEGLSAGAAVPAGYGGLNWSNVKIIDGSKATDSGYLWGLVSGTNVAYDPGAKPSILSSAGPGGFTLVDGFFTAAWSNGLQITASAVFEDSSRAVKTFLVDAAHPVDEVFGWSGLASVTFSSAGGVTSPGLSGIGRQFVFDDLTAFPTPPLAVPEPSTAAAMLAGLGLLLAARRRAASRARCSPYAAAP